MRTIPRREFLVSLKDLLTALCFTSPFTLPSSQATAKAPPSPVVAVVRASSYQRQEIFSAVSRALSLVEGLDDLIHPGARVGIKVNLTELGHTAEEGITTSPLIVEALITEVQKAGASKVWVLEGLGQVPDGFVRQGFTSVASRTGAQLVDTDRSPAGGFISLATGSQLVYPRVTLHPLYTDLDVFISVAKMKCHELTGVTLSLKNLVGILPTPLYSGGASWRVLLHGQDPWRRIPRIIIDLATTRPIHLAVIDGVIGLERGAGSWNPRTRPVPSGVIIVSKNAVAADAVATALMGFDPQAQYPVSPFVNAENHLRLAEAFQLGPSSLARIEVRTDPPQPLSNWKRSYHPPARDGRVPPEFRPWPSP